MFSAFFLFFPAFFTALHRMQTPSSDENSVCLFACQMRALWQNGGKIGPDFLYHAKDHLR